MRPWLLVLTLVALVAVGCRLADSPPDLLNVLDVAATTVDVGDQVEVIGTGFPEGRVGTVTFSGRLHRPGLAPERVSLTVKAGSASRNRVSLAFTEQLQHKLCGVGKQARHTTFRGDLVVAFSPRQAGAPPITGRLKDVVLDLSPPDIEPAVQSDLLAQGRRAAEFLGLTFDAERTSMISLVERGSRAEQAGLLAADHLLSFNGVVVRDLGDLVPAAGQRLVPVSVRRGRLQDPVTRLLDVDGFAPAAPRELAVAAMLVGFAVGVMLLFVAPIARFMTWAERRVASRLLGTRGARSRLPRTWVGWIGHGAKSVAAERLLPVERSPLVLRAVPYLQFLAVSVAFTLVAFGFPIVSEDLDLFLAMLASTTALVAIGLVLGGWRGARRWSMLSGFKSALLLLVFQFPAVGVFGAVVLTAGSSRAADLVARQGALPWEWSVFSNPLLLLGLALLLAAAVPEMSRASLELPEADPRDGLATAPSNPNPASRCLMFFAEWGHIFVVAGLAAVLLLGGWNVPGIDSARQAQDSRWQMLGAAILQVKCWGVVLFVRGLRWMLPRLSLEQMSGSFWRWLAPLTVLVIGLTLGWSWGQADDFVQSLQQRLSVVLFAVTLFVAVYLTFRVFANLSRKSGQLNVNPWL